MTIVQQLQRSSEWFCATCEGTMRASSVLDSLPEVRADGGTSSLSTRACCNHDHNNLKSLRYQR
jgi:hypothetical protein